MDCSLPFLKLTRRIRVPFLSRFLLLLFVYNCSLFLLRFVLFVFSLSLLPHVSTLSFCFETKLSPVFRTNPTWRRSEVALVWWRTWLLGNAFPSLDAAAAWRLGDTKGHQGRVEVRMGGVPSFYRNGKSGKWTSGCSENDNKSKLILTPSTNFGKFFWHSKVINTDQIYLLKCVNFIKQLTVLTREFVNRKTKAKYVKHS